MATEPSIKPRALFIAGATGAVGRTVCRIARAKAIPHTAHLRPGRDPEGFERPSIFRLDDADALDGALAGCTTVLQLIGTVRKRFARGDTYESSDIATTRQLVESARRVGVDHFVLLSALGAGRPVGAYLKAKARAESLVTGSGIPFTIFRPSVFDGEGRHAPPGLDAIGRLPGLAKIRTVHVEDLAGALLDVAVERAPLDTVLAGRALQALFRGL